VHYVLGVDNYITVIKIAVLDIAYSYITYKQTEVLYLVNFIHK